MFSLFASPVPLNASEVEALNAALVEFNAYTKANSPEAEVAEVVESEDGVVVKITFADDEVLYINNPTPKNFEVKVPTAVVFDLSGPEGSPAKTVFEYEAN